ncbi:acetate--CoA ligase family protein, partial [Calditrichota bacterium]
CDTLEEMLDTALAFENQPIPKGNKIAVVTNAGGPGILASDALESNGLLLASLSEKSINSITVLLPAEAAKTNPVDMIASATHDTYKNICQILVDDPGVDALFVIIVKPPVDTTPAKIIENLESVLYSTTKPFYVTLMARADQSAGLDKFQQLKVPVYNFPESAAKALGNVIKYKQIQERIKPFKIDSLSDLTNFSLSDKRQASMEEIISLFEKYDLPMCDFLVTNNLGEAQQFLKTNKNVALKVANPEIIHKSDSRLVKLNINTEQAMSLVFPEMLEKVKNMLPDGSKPKILVQKMVRGSVELVIGARKDEQFGPVLMFGLGGILVELFKDVAFRVLPIDIEEAKNMITEIKGYKLLSGYRNIAPVNLENLAKMLVKTGNMLMENPNILEMDMNPLIWSGGEDYPQIVDFRMTIAE